MGQSLMLLLRDIVRHEAIISSCCNISLLQLYVNLLTVISLLLQLSSIINTYEYNYTYIWQCYNVVRYLSPLNPLIISISIHKYKLSLQS